MEIGKIVDPVGGEEYSIQIDDDFLEFFVDAIRGAESFSKKAPKKNFDEDYKDGLNSIISFGKHKGKTWKSLQKDDPSYAEWAAANVERIPEWFKKILRGEDTEEF